jgi:hypothetical protein
VWDRSGKFTADVSAGEEENMEKEEPDFRHIRQQMLHSFTSPVLRIRIVLRRIRIRLFT